MFRREFLILCGLAAGLFLLVAAAGFWIGHTLSVDSNAIAIDTLPSLVDAGRAISVAQENWLRVQLVEVATSTAEQSALISQIRTNSNEGTWQDYAHSVYETEERLDYQDLLSARSAFLQLREEYFALALAGNGPAARQFLRQKLNPAYQRYLASSRLLFQFNARAGVKRAARMVWISRLGPPVLAASAVIIFGFGLLAGLRGALTGLNLASRFPRKNPR
jgi:hypothetical protein